MADRQHEPVAAHPVLVGRVNVHDSLEKRVRQRREAHSGAGVAGAAVLHGVRGEYPGRIHRPGVGVSPVLGVVALGHRLQFRGQRHGVLAFSKVAQKHIAYRRLREIALTRCIPDSCPRVGKGYHRPKV